MRRSDATGSAAECRVSTVRSLQLQTGGSFVVPPANTPSVWPAILVSFLHNLSMGAAMMVWIDVCGMAYGGTGLVPKDGEVPVAGAVDVVVRRMAAEDADESTSPPQMLYGRLLAVNAICELVTSQLVGVASDRVGRRILHIAAQVGQLIDYGAAALCLPPLFGMLGMVPEEWVAPLLYVTRGIAGALGNYRVSLQAYTTDISTSAEAPTRLSYLGASMVTGMCFGSGMVAAMGVMFESYRACYIMAACTNAAIIFIVVFFWRDVAPKKAFRCEEANPISGAMIFIISKTMVVYAILILMASFALTIYTSTLAHYSKTFLGMGKPKFIALGAEWAFLSAFAMTVVQPILTQKFGEIRTLQISFVALAVFYVLFSALTKLTWAYCYAIMPFFSLGTMSYPLAVGLATREVNPEDQGGLQGGVSVIETVGKMTAPLIAGYMIKWFEKDGQYHGMVYVLAAVVVAPGIFLSGLLTRLTVATAMPGSFTMELPRKGSQEYSNDVDS